MSKLAPPTPENITLGAVLDAWRVSLRATDKSPKTPAIYEWGLGKLLADAGETTPIAAVDEASIDSLYASLKASGLSAASRSGVDRPLRTFFRWAMEREYIAKDPMAKVAKPKVQTPPVEFVSDEEWSAILRTTVERAATSLDKLDPCQRLIWVGKQGDPEVVA